MSTSTVRANTTPNGRRNAPRTFSLRSPGVTRLTVLPSVRPSCRPKNYLTHQPDQRRVTLRATGGTLAGWTKITTHPSPLTPPAYQSTEDRT